MKGMKVKFFVTALLLLGLPLSAVADSLQQLKQFISDANSAQALFSQQVYDQQGEQIRDASGVMQFQRPGKFRWVYRQPYEQIIVGDGEKFWLYDTDLEQVTVKKLDAALGSSPAALLAGNNEIERAFSLRDAGMREGLSWLEARPKSEDGSFERILLGFDAQALLTVMELHDTLGYKTILSFSELQRNPLFEGNPFHFEPPPGVDVLSE